MKNIIIKNISLNFNQCFFQIIPDKSKNTLKSPEDHLELECEVKPDRESSEAREARRLGPCQCESTVIYLSFWFHKKYNGVLLPRPLAPCPALRLSGSDD